MKSTTHILPDADTALLDAQAATALPGGACGGCCGCDCADTTTAG